LLLHARGVVNDFGHLQIGKSPGMDSIFPEFILELGQFSNPGYAISLLSASAKSKLKGSGEEHE